MERATRAAGGPGRADSADERAPYGPADRAASEFADRGPARPGRFDRTARQACAPTAPDRSEARPRGPAGAARPPRPLPAATGEASSTSVFQSPQPGQRPCHFAAVSPQVEQVKTDVARAMGLPTLGAEPDGSGPVQSGTDVGQQVLRVLDAGRQPDEALAHRVGAPARAALGGTAADAN